MKRIIEHTTQEVFDLSDAHPVIEHDAKVARSNCWMYTNDMVSKRAGQRVSLRFAMPGADGDPSHVGVISTTIGTEGFPLVFRRGDVHSAEGHRRHRPVKRR